MTYTDEEIREKTKRFWSDMVWDYVQINQGEDDPITVPALRLGLFAVTAIEYSMYGDMMEAVVTHLPTGFSLGRYVSAYKFAGLIVDCHDLGEALNSIVISEIRGPLYEIGMKYHLIDDGAPPPELPDQIQRLNDKVSA
jgi:hypothetical protein